MTNFQQNINSTPISNEALEKSYSSNDNKTKYLKWFLEGVLFLLIIGFFASHCSTSEIIKNYTGFEINKNCNSGFDSEDKQLVTINNQTTNEYQTVNRNTIQNFISSIQDLTGTSIRMVVANPDGSLSTQPIPDTDVEGIIAALNTLSPTQNVITVLAGDGLSGGGTGDQVTLGIGQGTGISIGDDTVNVIYGSSSGTAVQGNTTLTVSAGTNLSGGGSVVLGTGASVSLNTVSDPTFSTSVTTPLLNAAGNLEINSAGNIIMSDDTLVGNGTFNNASADADLYVTGNLEVDGSIYGNFAGTLNPGLAAGSVLFQGVSGISGDDTYFFWDNANKRLGIGDNTPESAFTVGNGDVFQVNSAGDLVQIRGVSYSWPSSQAAAAGYVLSNDGSGNLSWVAQSGGSPTALSSLTAATLANTINNGDNAQVWNWRLTTANKTAFTFGESLASTALGSPSLVKVSTLANSTALPLHVINLGVGDSFRVDDSASDSTPFLIQRDGTVLIGADTNHGGPGNASKMFVYGGANGANIDVMGDSSIVGGDQATLELQSSDYSTGGGSTFMQQYGPGGLGSSYGFANQNLGVLSFQNVDTAIIGTSNTTPLIFGTDFTERMRLTGTGSLGIGTTTVSAKLHSLSTTEQLRLGYDASNYASFTVNATGDIALVPSGGDTSITGTLGVSGAVTLSNLPAGRFVKTTTGGLLTTDQYISLITDIEGILQSGSGGTGYDSYQVGDMLYSDSDDHLARLSIGAEGTVLTSISGVPTWVAPSGGTVTGTGTQNYLTKWSSGGTGIENSLLFDNGTNIGIGTSTPTQKLDVVGGAIRIDNDGSSASTAGCLRFSGTELQYSNDCSTYSSFATGSGFTDDGSTVRLTTSTDNLSLGTNISNGSKLYVLGSSTFAGDISTDTHAVNGLQDSGSIIPNMGFEVDNNNDNTPDNWTFSGTGGNITGTLLTTDSAQGNNAVIFSTESVVGISTATVTSTCFPITGGVTYNMYAQSKTITDSSNLRLALLLKTYTTEANCAANTDNTDYTAFTENAPVNTSYASKGGTVSPVLTQKWGRAQIEVEAASPGVEDLVFDSFRMTPSSLTTSADYMEMYPVDEQATMGDIVVPTSLMVTTKDGEEISQLTRSNSPYQKSTIGIVSDKSKAGEFNSIGHNIHAEDNPQPIALAGRVPVKIAANSPAIEPGDFITTSNELGKGMKATKAGHMVGRAIESWSPISGKATVMVFVMNTFADPQDVLSQFALNTNGELIISSYEETIAQQSSQLEAINSSVLGMQATQSAALSTLDTEIKDIQASLTSFTSLVASLAADITTFGEWKSEAEIDISSLKADINYLKSLNGVSSASDAASLFTSEEATMAAITVTDNANINNLGVTGTFTAGLITIDGLAGEINTLSNPLKLQPLSLGTVEIMGGKVDIDKKGTLAINEGQIKGNDSFRGKALLKAGETEIRVERDWPDAPFTIHVTTTYNTNVWVEQIDETGFTIKVDTTESSDKDIHWIAMW